MSDHALQYREISPPGVLADFVRCIWRLHGDPGQDAAGGSPEPIIPDGCAEIVVNVGDPFIRHAAGEPAASEAPEVAPAPPHAPEATDAPDAPDTTASSDGKPAPQKSMYDSLEQEMASLLNRPPSKP